MYLFHFIPGPERLVPFVLFMLYLVTAVRICRYSAWIHAGAPNPFLPQRLRRAATRREIATLVAAEIRARAPAQPTHS